MKLKQKVGVSGPQVPMSTNGNNHSDSARSALEWLWLGNR